MTTMDTHTALAAWASPHYDKVVIDHVRGTYRQFRVAGGKLADYPLDGVIYPVDYGHLPDHIAEDGEALDVFLGDTRHGEYGKFTVYRPDVKGGYETKYYFGLSQEQKALVLDAFEPVRVGNPKVFTSPEKLEWALSHYRPENKGFRDAMIKAIADDIKAAVEGE
jgi:hypothetical protein